MNASTQPIARTSVSSPTSARRPKYPRKQALSHAQQNPHLYKWPKGDMQVPLLSKTAIAVTTFFGGATAGALMIAINYMRRDGNKATPKVIMALMLGLAGSAATVAASMINPVVSFLTIPLYLGIAGIVASLAESMFEADYATRKQAGIKPMNPAIGLAAFVAGIFVNFIVAVCMFVLVG